MTKQVHDGEVVSDSKPAQQSQGVLTKKDERDFKLAVMKNKTSVMDPVEYAQTKKLAADFLASGSVARSFDNVNQVMMALLAGREMGMSTTESLNGLYFVDGKLNIYGKATPAALRRHGWQIKFKDESDNSCTAVVSNVNTGEVIEDTFTFEEAEKSGFTKDRNGNIKFGWKPGINRKRKLRYGVLSLIIHTYLPDVVGGVTSIGEYSEDYVEGERVSSRAASDEKLEKAAETLRAAKSLDELKQTYMGLSGSEKVALAQLKDELKSNFEESV